METLLKDLRYGIRMLLKSPGFSAVAVLSLALGIGANTAIFTLIDSLLLRRLPVKEPQQLALLAYPTATSANLSFSYPFYEQVRDRAHLFSGILATSGAGRTRFSVKDGGGQTELIRAERVSGNFFSVLGINAALGRTLIDDDDHKGNPNPVAVISYAFWKRRFGLNPAVVGKSITINDVPLSIVGVTPPTFTGVQVDSSPDLWWPLQMLPQIEKGSTNLTERGSWWLRLIARLQPGTTLAQASAETDGIFQQMLNEMAEANKGRGINLTPTERRNFFDRRIVLQSGAVGFSWLRQYTKPLLILMLIVGLVLLIACANVANLLLARAAARQKEIAVRLALGASRWRLVRQLLTESVLLATVGGVLGLFLAQWGARTLVLFLPQQSGSLSLNLDPDIRVLGFTTSISLLTGILFGLAPAIRGTRINLTPALKDGSGSRGSGGRRITIDRVLVVSQVALSLFLLIGAGLFVRSLQRLKSLDAGFDRENVMLFSIDTGTGYTTDRRVNMYKQVLTRLEALPGARSASLSSFSLLSGNSSSTKVAVQGYNPKPDEDMSCYYMWVGPNYFQTMGIPVLLGRDFNAHDEKQADPAPTTATTATVAGTPVGNGQPAPIYVVINQSLARYFFGAESPIGKHMGPSFGKTQTQYEIIGVVKDAKYVNLREPTPRTFYTPYFQSPHNGGMTFELRTFGDPVTYSTAIRREIQAIDSNLQVLDFRTMNDVVDNSLNQERFTADLASFFSLFALLLACIGLYGILSYAVVRRTSEIGIRMALGARQTDVVWLVMKETLVMVIIGVAVAVPAALATTRMVSSLLYDVTATDPLTIVLASITMIAVAAFAGFLPARRASRVDPMIALRHD